MVYVKLLSEHLYRKKCKNRRYLTYEEDFYVLLAVLFAWERGTINTVLEVIPLILKIERADSSEALPSICQRTWGRIPDGINPQHSLIQDIRLYGEIRYPAKLTVESALRLNIPSAGSRISIMRNFFYYSPHPTHTLTHSLKHIHRSAATSVFPSATVLLTQCHALFYLNATREVALTYTLNFHAIEFPGNERSALSIMGYLYACWLTRTPKATCINQHFIISARETENQ